VEALRNSNLPEDTAKVTFRKPGLASGSSNLYQMIDLGWASEEQMAAFSGRRTFFYAVVR